MKILITLFIAFFIGLGSAFAADGEKKPAKGKKPRPILNEDQRELMKEIREKYDADKDGKLTPQERAKISDEDMKRVREARMAILKDRPNKGPPKKEGGKKGKGGKKNQDAEK